jgi:hypothetical protein
VLMPLPTTILDTGGRTWTRPPPTTYPSWAGCELWTPVDDSRLTRNALLGWRLPSWVRMQTRGRARAASSLVQPAGHDAYGPPKAQHCSVPNGKPGDHPLTDLLHWNSPTFGEPVDSLLREIVKLGGERTLDRSPWREQLWDLWPRWSRSGAKDAEIAALVEPLTELRDRLKSEARERGWEVE